MKTNSLVVLAILSAGWAQHVAADSEPAVPQPTAAQAKTLALNVHAEAAAIDQLPSFRYRIKSGNGDVDTMRDRDECSVEGLKEALDGPVAEPDWLQWGVTLAWTEKHALWSASDWEGPRFGEAMKTSRQDRVWTKDLAFDRRATSGRQARFVYTPTANRLWEMRLRELAYFRVTPHQFWWATSNHHYDTISPVLPEQADYRFVAQEHFDGDLCDVIESPSRAERLWIARESGRLRALLISMYRGDGPKDQFYQNERVQKIAGRSFASPQEYRAWYSADSTSPQQMMEIARIWNELNFESFGPNELIRFRDYREVAPGVWIPFREDRAFTHGVEGNLSRHKYIRLWVAVQEVQTNVDLAETVESLQPKEGEQIQDQRFGVVVNYKFQHDRTQGELLELIEAERQRQVDDAEIVKRLIAPIAELVGKPASALPLEGWVGGPPPKMVDQPYLIHFWATWCGPCKNDLPLLKRLAAEGLPVVGMHPAGTSAEEIGSVIDDRQLGYPTYLASSEGDARKIGGYPVAMFPYCILVDRAGQVVGHGSLGPELVTQLRALSKKD